MRTISVLLLLLFFSLNCHAQLEVKKNSFKEVTGFINLHENPDYQVDDNNQPYAVIKVKTEHINNKERHQLLFEGDARTYIMHEYKTGEVWLYISYYATYLKISHHDLSSIEYYFPYDLQPKKGYELILVNKNNEVPAKIPPKEQDKNQKSDNPKEQPVKSAPQNNSYDMGFMTFNASINNYGKPSYGFTIGMRYKSVTNSLFLSINSNSLSKQTITTDYNCGNDFLVNGHYPSYTGNMEYRTLSMIFGIVLRNTKPLSFRLGMGYGINNVFYEVSKTTLYSGTNFSFVKNTDLSVEGIELSVGTQYYFKGFLISIDGVTTRFKYYALRLGIGLAL